MPRSRVNAALGVCLCAFLVGASVSAIAAEPSRTIDITMHLAEYIRLDSDISTVIIGSPDIADASVTDERSLVLTGKGFGITNMMVFDKTGQQIATLLLRVGPPQAHRVIVRQDSAGHMTFLCLPVCSQLPPTVAETPTPAVAKTPSQ